MIINKEDFIDSEILEILKKINYNIFENESLFRPNGFPTLYEIQKWLRINYKLIVTPEFSFYTYTGEIIDLYYYYTIYNIQNEAVYNECLFKEITEPFPKLKFKTYEEALKEGIKEALKFI